MYVSIRRYIADFALALLDVSLMPNDWRQQQLSEALPENRWYDISLAISPHYRIAGHLYSPCYGKCIVVNVPQRGSLGSVLGGQPQVMQMFKHHDLIELTNKLLNRRLVSASSVLSMWYIAAPYNQTLQELIEGVENIQKQNKLDTMSEQWEEKEQQQQEEEKDEGDRERRKKRGRKRVRETSDSDKTPTKKKKVSSEEEEVFIKSVTHFRRFGSGAPEMFEFYCSLKIPGKRALHHDWLTLEEAERLDSQFRSRLLNQYGFILEMEDTRNWSEDESSDCDDDGEDASDDESVKSVFEQHDYNVGGPTKSDKYYRKVEAMMIEKLGNKTGSVSAASSSPQPKKKKKVPRGKKKGRAIPTSKNCVFGRFKIKKIQPSITVAKVGSKKLKLAPLIPSEMKGMQRKKREKEATDSIPLNRTPLPLTLAPLANNGVKRVVEESVEGGGVESGTARKRRRRE